MKQATLTLLIGQYAQKRYLAERFRPTLTNNVKHFREFLPELLPLVHPSPRNKIWQKKNPWFEAEIVPALQQTVADIIN
jgi:hypothetical protein